MNNIGNITTTIKTICMLIAGYTIGYLVSIGLQLPINQEQLAEILFTLLTLIGAYLDAKYPNNFQFLHPEETLEQETETVLNDEYVKEKMKSSSKSKEE